MGTLFVDRKDSRLELRAGIVCVRSPGATAQQVPTALVERVVLRANTELSSATLASLANAGIGVLALGGRDGQRMAHLLGAPGKDIGRRITQVRRLQDTAFCHAWCQRVVHGKLHAQQRLLHSALQQRGDLRKPLLDAIATITAARDALSSSADVNSLRGLEGAGAAAFFRAYTHLFPASLDFHARRRRPPPDPVNAVLSLGYTLLLGLAVEAAHASGLDPAIGYLHTPYRGRQSLACDLMEPWRPWVDQLTWTLFRERALGAEHFSRVAGGACLLGKTGRSRFYARWAAHTKPLRRAMRRHAALADKALGNLALEYDVDSSTP